LKNEWDEEDKAANHDQEACSPKDHLVAISTGFAGQGSRAANKDTGLMGPQVEVQLLRKCPRDYGRERGGNA
jgi:hypothetical protein